MTTQRAADATETIDVSLKKRLDSHGYAFQYAVIRRCETLFRARESSFAFEVAEFPVALQGGVTHIDFVLRADSVYLVAECKRVNPALARWCFARAPYIRRNRSATKTIVECVRTDSNTGQTYSSAMVPASGEPFHVGVELRTAATGDPDGRSRGSIDEAVTQVCRGLNGLIGSLVDHPRLMPGPLAFVVPVIFTTAELHATPVDLGDADLSTGKLESVQASEVAWLWYQHNVSPALRHSAPRKPSIDRIATLGDLLEHEHARSVAIVGPGGIQPFLVQMAELAEFVREV